ncbi:CRISPR-associated endoribonuclease Cas6 [Desulfurobacterium thermolithotrophum]|uniref:CRISPR-associated endoribonuclease Cas6 n=1 Tax=Desulfurobacterium thermolithotrophum TaxID=64160 RepID=UPI0013D0CA8B|nr:CRISPR-associated endoribonuclease Cas6 [Desulfurobacterium thermolithotrophum]
MKFRILINTQKLPILYRHRIISLFKEALKLSDPEYKDFLYDSNTTKPFTFNLFLPKGFTIKKEPLQIDEKFTPEDYPELREMETFYLPENTFLTIWISSTDYRFLISLYNGLQKLKTFNFSSDDTMLVNGEKLTWEIKKVFAIEDRVVMSRKVLLKTCSPVLIEKSINGKKKPVLFTDDDFEKELNFVMDKILKSLRGYGLKEPLSFKVAVDPKNRKPLAKSQKVKHTLKEFREKTGLPYMTLTVNRGMFQIEGDPEDINYMLKIGIGNRTGQGFGMVEVVG